MDVLETVAAAKRKVNQLFGFNVNYSMRALLFFMLLVCTQTALAQDLKWKLKQYAKAAPGYIVAGAADGLNQTLWAHYDHFKRVHPNANDQYWNPYNSWTNKYDYGMLGQTSFVWITDAHHLTRTVNRTAIRFNNSAFPISRGKQKWYWYMVDLTYLFLVESIGFHSTYSIIYK